NLVNIISVGFFSIPFLEYARMMILPDIVSIAASAIMLYVIFRRSFPNRIPLESLPKPETVVRDMKLLKISFVVIALMIALYAIAGFFLIPISLVAVPGVALFYLFAKTRTNVSGKKIVRNTPWEIIFFALGLFIVVYALSKHGLVGILETAMLSLGNLVLPLRLIGDAFLFSFLASIMN
ncbi:arsenical pump membrane protein, partial [mine drainage metagenome]